jgi:hypothetical protein
VITEEIDLEMSQDLLAAFGFGEDDPASHPVPNPTRAQGIGSLMDDEDDWGDFEAAESKVEVQSKLAAPIPPAAQVPNRRHYNLDDLGPQQPSILQSRSKPEATMAATPATLREPVSSARQVSPGRDPNVLFDASEPSEDEHDGFDDFGEFASEEPAVPTKPAIVDLLGLDEPVEPVSKPQKHKKNMLERELQELNIVESVDDGWDEFPEDSKTSVSKSVPPNPSVVVLPSFPGYKDAVNAPDAVPPTNVPPPVIVLSLFPELFDRVNKELLKPSSSTSSKPSMSDETTLDYLKGYLAVLGVLARVIAGRKHRWKRDAILAQSMRIGPASSSRLSGMKVAGLDKTESAKEDREVAEILRLWNIHVGRLRSAVSEAKKTSDVGTLPEIREMMPVRTAKEAEGAVSSTKPCALCGLKREERIAKVDGDVMDAFGEWWVERTNMHRGKYIP